MKKIFLSIIFSYLFFNSHATNINHNSNNKVSDTLSNIIEDLSKDSILEYRYVGYTGQASKQYILVQKLSKMATSSYLENLCITSKNPVLKVICYLILTNNNIALSESAYNNLINDNTTFAILSGCIASNSTVSKYVQSKSNKLNYFK